MTEQFTALYQWIFTDLRLTGNEAIIYAKIYSFSKGGRPFTMTQQRLANEFNLSLRTVGSLLKSLNEKGFLIKDDKGNMFAVRPGPTRNNCTSEHAEFAHPTRNNCTSEHAEFAHPTRNNCTSHYIEKKDKKKDIGDNTIRKAAANAGGVSVIPDSEMWFSTFWNTYLIHDGQSEAEKAFKKVCKTEKDYQTIMNGLRRLNDQDYRHRDKNFIPNPARWLNERKWNDEARPPKKGTNLVF